MENISLLISLISVIIVIAQFFIGLNRFVKPEALEERLSKERENNDKKYMSKELCHVTHEPISDMKSKIDEIYKLLIGNNRNER
jgi:hypothetical protein